LLGGVPDVDGGVDGVPGFVGGVDGVGQFALASITDPSGHVLVVGGGVNVCVHDGSFGFFVQSTGGGVPVVQLPAAHVDPAPGPPDAGIDVLLGCITADANDFVVLTYGHVVLSLHVDGGGGGVIPCSFASPMSQSLVLRFLSRSVTALLSARSHFGSWGSHFPVIGLYTHPG
jgi:hypothetical protein